MKKLILNIIPLLLVFSSSATAALYEFSYISNDFGSLGSFTMDEQDIIDNIGDNLLGGSYVLNDFIQDLNFSYGGMTWNTADIAIGPMTAHAFDISGSVPILFSANGPLATNTFSQSITMYGGFVMFGGDDVLGNWETSIAAVPLPASLWLMISGCLSLIGITRLKKS
ncbi:VPLPA-CTERM sorting domain-containing protein [Pseudomonadota bacterium]